MIWKLTKLLLGALLVSILLTARPQENTQPIEVKEAAQTAVSSTLDTWIEDLVQLESEGREDVVIIDTNGKHSRGCLQFQDATFSEYSERYNIKGDIMSCDFQKKLAKLMILENPKNWKHWWTSVKVKKLGPPPNATDTSN